MAQGVNTRPAEHAGKFNLAYGLLALVLGAAIATFVILATRGSGSGGSTPVAAGAASGWSTFRPQSLSGIAHHVEVRYRDAGHHQLVLAKASSPPEVLETPLTPTSTPNPAPAILPITGIALPAQPGQASPVVPGWTLLPAASSVEYQLCGLGPGCAIAGQGTSATGTSQFDMLRRQALEMTLYTLEYAPADSVVVLLPPLPGVSQHIAYFFQRSDLQAQLSQPLTAILPDADRASAAPLTPAQERAVDAVTRDHAFAYQYRPLLDGTFMITLQGLTGA
ncbi:MAG: hypothetical protein ACXVYV_04890 [Gaiellales bacterium]